LLRDLKERAAEAMPVCKALAAGSKNGRRPTFSNAEVLELLKSYPKCRYQSLVMQHVITASSVCAATVRRTAVK